MEIALHLSHTSLPLFGSGKAEQPFEMYVPKVVDARVLTLANNETRLVADDWTGPILKGVHAIKTSFMMAHFSAFSRTASGSWHSNSHFWVQFTTAVEKGKDGIPLIIRGKKLQVEHLWGPREQKSSPYDFLPDTPGNNVTNAGFWKEFFIKKLSQTKASASDKEARAAKTRDARKQEEGRATEAHKQAERELELARDWARLYNMMIRFDEE